LNDPTITSKHSIKPYNVIERKLSFKHIMKEKKTVPEIRARFLSAVTYGTRFQHWYQMDLHGQALHSAQKVHSFAMPFGEQELT